MASVDKIIHDYKKEFEYDFRSFVSDLEEENRRLENEIELRDEEIKELKRELQELKDNM